jgi:Ni/Co efflux regulator RcnB
MKKFILSAIAASMIASPMVASEASAQGYPQNSQHQRHETVVRHQPGRTVVVDRTVTRNHGPQYRNDWRRGERFDYRRARNYQVINNYRGYRLRTPPRGYHYVRSGNDAVLVGITSGIIAGIIAGAIR